MTHHDVPLAVASALAGIFCITVAAAAEYDYRTTPLREKSLAPLSVSLPDWKVFEAFDLGTTGKMRLADPTGDARMIEIDWQLGDGRGDVPAMAPLLAKSGFHQLSSVALHAPLKGTAARFANDGETKRVVISSIYCRESDTTLEVWSFLNSSWDDEQYLSERILNSVRCHDATRSAPVFPVFSPRNGYAKVSNSTDGIVYANAAGDAILFSSHQPPRRNMKPKNWAEAVFALMSKGLDLRHLAFNPDARHIAGKDVLYGDAQRADGSHVFLLATWWECARPQQDFFGIYVGAANPAVTRESELLASAQCP